jgi:UDP-glucose 4-epimerase
MGHMTCLVTGGAGYIGSHIIASLQKFGYKGVAIDDLSTGFASRIPGIPLLEKDISEDASVEIMASFMKEHRVTSVIHTAALKSVPDSVADPLRYYRINVGGTVNLLEAMNRAGIKNFVLSSTAAVYGMAKGEVTELSPTLPINPYGATKLAGEDLLKAMNAVGKIHAISLRYFNVAGTADDAKADNFATNLIPQALRWISEGKRPKVFGTDYDTVDGSCERDYIHVADLAEAHILALKALEQAGDDWAFDVFNVGTGTGYSVLQVVDLAIQASGATVAAELTDRRPGDPARIVANPAKIHSVLGWHHKHSLEDMVTSAWSGIRSRDQQQ